MLIDAEKTELIKNRKNTIYKEKWMEVNTDEIAKKCMDAINEKLKNLKKLNIIVVGKSGVGKSTLINSLFRDKIAETGLGRPITTEIRKIEKKDYPMAIYDTPGFELSEGQQAKVKEEIIELIHKGLATGDINNVGGNRTFDQTEINWLKELIEKNKVTKVPIIVVLTQACPKTKGKQMQTLVEKENLDIIKVIPVLAQDMDFDGEYVAKAYGLDQLVDIMSEALPEELQDTLQNVQKASLKSKKKRSRAVVAAASAVAFGEGFIPIPFSDAAVLIPTQITMIASITTNFGMSISKSVIMSFISSTIGTAGTTILGKSMVSNLFKLIPGVGTGVGGMISGSTASLLTTALGEAYIKFMEMIYKGELKKEDLYDQNGQKAISKMFKEELTKKRKQSF